MDGDGGRHSRLHLSLRGNLRFPTSSFKRKPAQSGRLFYFLLSDCCQGPKWILITPFTCKDGSLNRIESAKV
jgi:hypothetical protein